MQTVQKVRKVVPFVLFLLLSVFSLQEAASQPGWNWPNDSLKKEKAIEYNALYSDYCSQNNYRAARAPFVWLIQNAPDLNKSLYINGVKIYENLADQEQDPAQKAALQDSVMLLYDQRIQYFGQEAYVLNRKAIDAYKFYRKDPKKYQMLYKLMTRAFALNGNKVSKVNLQGYMDVISRYKKAGGALTDLQVVDLYDQIVSILNNQEKAAKKAGKSLKSYDLLRKNISRIFERTVDIDCAYVAEKLAPRLRANPDDLQTAENIYKLSIKLKCFKLDVFVQAARVVYKHSPSFFLAKTIGKDLLARKDYDDAKQYLDDAFNRAKDNEDKADILMLKAALYQQKTLNAKAREQAFMALKFDPGRKEAYSFVGNLYYNSYKLCKKGASQLDDRAVFFAAYDMFQKAGDKKGMALAKQQFPTVETAFTENKYAGDPIKVNCWINITTTIRIRK